jgi:transposase
MRDATADRAMAPSLSTCRARTGATPSGRRERLQRQAQGIGPNTEALIIAVMARWPHPEQGFRTGLGVLRLFRGLDAARVEAVSLRAVEIGALSYASIASILKHRLDRSAPPQAADGTPLLHANIRGPRYYH